MATRLKLFSAILAISLAIETAAQLPNATDELVTRTFKLDVSNIGLSGQPSGAGPMRESLVEIGANTNLQTRVRQFLASGGLTFPSDPFSPFIAPTEKSMFFNERTHELVVRASRDEIQRIESMLRLRVKNPPLVQIETRVVEFKEIDRPSPLKPNADIATRFQVLTDKQFQTSLSELEKSKDAEMITAPSVTTISGRQARVAIEDKRKSRMYQDPPALPKDTSPDADPTPQNSGRLPFPPTFNANGDVRRTAR